MPRPTKPLTQQTVTKRPPRASAAQALVLARLAHGWHLSFVNLAMAYWRDETGRRRGCGFLPSINGLWTRNLIELGDRADESTPQKSIRYFTLTHAGRAAGWPLVGHAGPGYGVMARPARPAAAKTSSEF